MLKMGLNKNLVPFFKMVGDEEGVLIHEVDMLALAMREELLRGTKNNRRMAP